MKKPTPTRWLHLGISINADLRARLKATARAERRSVSFLVRSILEANLPELPKKRKP